MAGDPGPYDVTRTNVTVTILTWNGEQYLEAILVALEQQCFEGTFDILVIDSGSTDSTLEIVARHAQVRLHSIPKGEFGHGRTRNLAAELSTGEIVAYLTHDAVPAHDRWLAELTAPFRDDARIAAVLGKQVARPSAPPALKYDIRRVFEGLGPDYGMTVVWDSGRNLSEDEIRIASFYSDANSAARREVIMGPVPYRDVDYAEDQAFGRDLFRAGYRRAYAPHALVEHSNDTTLFTFGSRIIADLDGLRRIGTAIPRVSRLSAVRQWIKWSTADAAFILLDHDYRTMRKLYWLIVNPWFQAVKWNAYRRGSLHDRPPTGV